MSGEGEKPQPTGGSSSRASSPAPGLDRVISGRHLDDQYHGIEAYADTGPDDDDDETREAREAGEAEEAEVTDNEADLSGNDSATEEPGAEKESSKGEEAGDDVIGASASEKDLEAGKLEKAKTASSKRSKTRDPNLVTWDGPKDPENPKNWRQSRKWAATIVGKDCLIFLHNGRR